MTEMPYDNHLVGRRIRILRTMAGMTQAEFANHCGLRRGEVAAWESGGRRPSIPKCYPILIRFPEVDLDWILLGNIDSLSVATARKIVEIERGGCRPTQA